MTTVAFTVPGEPQGKGRPRIVRVGGFSRMATPPKTAAYESLVALAASQAMAGQPLFEGPCRIDVTMVCGIPASWSDRKRAAAMSRDILPAKKPDADNILKAVYDGINGVVWKDDVQAVSGYWAKVFGTSPGVHVTVTAMRVDPR